MPKVIRVKASCSEGERKEWARMNVRELNHIFQKTRPGLGCCSCRMLLVLRTPVQSSQLHASYSAPSHPGNHTLFPTGYPSPPQYLATVDTPNRDYLSSIPPFFVLCCANPLVLLPHPLLERGGERGGGEALNATPKCPQCVRGRPFTIQCTRYTPPFSTFSCFSRIA